jgi:hypothetical protein
MQSRRWSDPLNARDRLALHLGGEHQAGVDQPAVEQDVAGAAVTVVAPLLAAGQAEVVAEDFKEALPRLAEELDRVAR